MKINAHIPTQQYGFIELTDLPDDPAEIERLYNKYAEKPISLTAKVVRLIDIFGNPIDYDPVRHEYWWEGTRYLSGSEYAKQFEEPFDKATISERVAKKTGRSVEDVLAEWELNAEVSRGFGTAIHGAIELAGRHGKVHAHPILKQIVESFTKKYKGPYQYEVLVVDHKSKHAGRIDLLGSERILDIKTNGNIDKSLPMYWEQLKFYAQICEANGYKISGLDICHWNGGWTTYSKELA